MKRFFFVIFTLIICLDVTAQEYSCYESNRSKGLKQMQNGQNLKAIEYFNKAIEYFNAAKSCPDVPSNNDLKSKIDECQREIRKIQEETITLSLSQQELSFEACGGTKSIIVTTNGDWSISTGMSSWGHLTPDGNTLSVRVDQNTSTSSRTDWFEIKAGNVTKRVNVTQKGSTTLALSTQELSFESNGGTQTITVTTNDSWSISTGMRSWGHLTPDGNTLSVRVDPNTNTSSRTDWFEIKAGNVTKRVNVTQKGESTTLALSAQELSFESDGGTRTITVTTNESWNISTDMVSWGHLTPEGNTLKVRVDQNTSTSSRTDWFEIKAGTITKRVNVTQKAASITLSLSLQELNFEATGGTKTITITTNGTWSIGTDMLSWGHLTKNGNTLKVRVDSNPSSSSRTDWFTIKAGDIEKRVNVTQKGEIKPSATITSVTQLHNQPYNMYTNCMKITVKFETSRLQHKKIYCYAYFYGADNVTPLHTQWGNQVSTSNSDTAPYEYTTFTMTLAMSYLDLNMAPGFSGYLTFDIVIKDSAGNVLARQDNNSFSYTRGWY